MEAETDSNKSIEEFDTLKNHLHTHTKAVKDSMRRDLLTINVPVVFMARYLMVLRGATSLRGAFEGVGPENPDFFGP